MGFKIQSFSLNTSRQTNGGTTLTSTKQSFGVFRSFSSTSRLFQDGNTQQVRGPRPPRENTPEEAHIKSLYVNKDYQGVESYFEALKSSGQELTGAIYTVYMKALAARGALKNIYRTVEEWKSLDRNARLGDRFRLGTGMHVAFIRAFRQRSLFSGALKYFDALQGQDKAAGVYYEIIDFLADKGRAETVVKLLDEMREKGFRMTPSTYMSCTKVFGQRRMVDKLLEVAAQAKQDGIPVDIRFYRSLMFGLAKAGSLENVLKQFEELKGAGIPVDNSIYNTLVAAYAGQGDVEQAQKMVAEMKSKALPLNEFTYTSLMKAYARKDDLDGLIKQFESLKQAVTPTTAGYNSILGYLKGKDDAVFEKYLNEMKEKGIEHNDSTRKILAPPEQVENPESTGEEQGEKANQ